MKVVIESDGTTRHSVKTEDGRTIEGVVCVDIHIAANALVTAEICLHSFVTKVREGMVEWKLKDPVSGEWKTVDRILWKEGPVWQTEGDRVRVSIAADDAYGAVGG